MSEALTRLTAALADRYRIEREVGAGGMATVYLAEDLRHGRQVALKVLRPELAATLGSERFFREIQVAARLQHPHILPLHDSGEAGGFLYFVMPYVDGESLRDRLARVGELPVHDAVKILLEVVDALAYAHGQGVVHRDIKPDNVMLSGRHALVTDFGVAKAVSEATGRQQLTTAGVALGTPSYMAPEQAAADPNLDHRVDIYAVGAMAYELLTGRPPFTGMTSQQILAAHVTQAPDPVSRHRPSCPPALEAVIMRCLAKRAADRFQTAEELLQNLEPLATPSGGMTPTQTRPVTAWQEATGRRNWMPAVVAGGVVVLAALGWLGLRPRRAAPMVPMERVQVTFTGTAENPALAPDGKRIAYSTRQCDAEGRCTLDIVVQDVEGAGAATVLQGAAGIWQIAWSADGRYLVFDGSIGGETWGVYSVPSLGGAPRHLGCCFGGPTYASDTALVSRAPDVGDSIGWVRWVTIADGVVRDSLPVRTEAQTTLTASMSPDGTRLLIEPQRGRLRTAFVTARDGTPLDSVEVLSRGAPLAWAPDGRAIIMQAPRAGTEDQDLLRYRVSSRGRIAPVPDTVARQVAITGNALGALNRSGMLVYASGPAEFSVWALRRARTTDMRFERRRLALSTGLIGGTITPDGRHVILNRGAPGGEGRRQFSVVPFDSGPELPLGPPVLVRDFDPTGDSKAILLATRRGADSVSLSRVALASGRAEPAGALGSNDFFSFEATNGGGLVIAPTRSSFRRIGIPGLPDSTFQLPVEVGNIIRIDPSPDGRAFVSSGFDQTGDLLVFHRVSLVDGSATLLARFGPEDLADLAWLSDDTVVLGVQESDWTQAWYRVPAAGGTPIRLGTAPWPRAYYRFSSDGLRITARVQDRRTDIYLVPNFAEVLEE